MRLSLALFALLGATTVAHAEPTRTINATMQKAMAPVIQQRLEKEHGLETSFATDVNVMQDYHSHGAQARFLVLGAHAADVAAKPYYQNVTGRITLLKNGGFRISHVKTQPWSNGDSATHFVRGQLFDLKTL